MSGCAARLLRADSQMVSYLSCIINLSRGASSATSFLPSFVVESAPGLHVVVVVATARQTTRDSFKSDRGSRINDDLRTRRLPARVRWMKTLSFARQSLDVFFFWGNGEWNGVVEETRVN